MSILEWGLSYHPFLKYAREIILEHLQGEATGSIDNVIISSRLPVRTVLFVLHDLIKTNQIEAKTLADRFDYVEAEQQRILAKSSPIISRYAMEKYLSLSAEREKAALLWGQRRLIACSVVDRLFYIANNITAPFGKIAFLGDDDMVSPLVAVAYPRWSVEVFDIDDAVLKRAAIISDKLNSRVGCHHVDLSLDNSAWRNAFDIVICDPFPSVDGSFEGMFWAHAKAMLQTGGVLISTIAPSHKPLEFSVGALNKLLQLGFCIRDLRSDYGKYEIFDFEFTSFEKKIITEYHINPHISHTKSLFSARLIAKTNFAMNNKSGFDFKEWTAGIANHYLTLQAGIDKQLEIASSRGLYRINKSSIESQKYRFRVETLIPHQLRPKVSEDRIFLADYWEGFFEKAIHVRPTTKELREIINLLRKGDLSMESELPELGLAIRILESWERGRFDFVKGKQDEQSCDYWRYSS